LIERAQAMPKQGASSGFKYGRAVGALEGVITCCCLRVYWCDFDGYSIELCGLENTPAPASEAA
jgi:hypothetical protein